MIDILLSALFLSIVMVGIHSYFGLEIIKRGIIFTDLSIGQMAAFGAAISLFLFDGNYIYVISLLFAIGGAILIAHSSKKSSYPEAVIGLIYAFSLSAVYIVLSNTYHGMEEFQKFLASDILFTPISKLFEIGIIYFGIALLLIAINRYIKHDGIKTILFFVLFAITVTSSVKLAGVLVVFAFLLSPSIIALSITNKHFLVVSWIVGTVLNILAIYLSYALDLPTGYTLVSVHTACAILITVCTRR